MRFSVGIGLTNDCNLNCAHCYRDTDRVSRISLEQVQTICDNLRVASMGMGTGENALHPQFIPIVEYLHERGIKLTMASNGHSLMAMSDERLQMFHDVEVSIDFATQEEQDDFRGEGNWDLVHRAMDRCRHLGVEVSILTTLMSVNCHDMDRLVALARSRGVNLRVNAYQPVHTDTFRLGYEQFWEGYRRLFSAGQVVSCTEPVVRAAMAADTLHPADGLHPADDDVRSPCARHSIRFNPVGQIIPCVYWPVDPSLTPRIEDLPRLGERIMDTAAFVAARLEPDSAALCACRGGCASRRALNGSLDAHDEYCPWVRGEDMNLNWTPAPDKELLRGRNYCTTIVV
jgi:MoaA/NifB/PqqE/SkfB family radical SAM enzyme